MNSKKELLKGLKARYIHMDAAGRLALIGELVYVANELMKIKDVGKGETN